METVFVIVKNNDSSLKLLKQIGEHKAAFKKFNSVVRVYNYDKISKKNKRQLKVRGVKIFPTIIFDDVAYIDLKKSMEFVNIVINSAKEQFGEPPPPSPVKNNVDEIKEYMTDLLDGSDDDNEEKLGDIYKEEMRKRTGGAAAPPTVKGASDNVTPANDDDLMNKWLLNHASG